MSLSELFGMGGEGETPFDPANFNAALDDIMGQHYPPADPPPAADPADPAATPAAPPLDPAAAAPPVAPVAPAAPPAPSFGAVTDPFGDLTDLERSELLAVRQALADPERSLAVKRAYLGVPAEAPVAAAPPAPVAAPTLPEHVDPESFEAQLWHQNQALAARLDQLTAGVTTQAHQTEAERAHAAAERAVANFATRYGDKLSREEIAAIASSAGAQKLPEAFLPTTGGNLEAAMGKSLEFALRSNDDLLAKILSAPAAPAGPPGHTPEAADRQRKLTALSSAASPTGEVPVRKPIEHRPDGRLTEDSRNAVLAQMVGKLNDSEGN